MEEKPYFPPDPEEQDEDDEEDGISRKKRSSAFEMFVNALKKETKTEKNEDQAKGIGRSIFERAVEKEKPDAEAKSTKAYDTPEKAEQEPPILSPEEEQLVNEALARKHRESPVVDPDPVEAVDDFLAEVEEGSDPEEALEIVSEQRGWSKEELEAVVETEAAKTSEATASSEELAIESAAAEIGDQQLASEDIAEALDEADIENEEPAQEVLADAPIEAEIPLNAEGDEPIDMVVPIAAASAAAGATRATAGSGGSGSGGRHGGSGGHGGNGGHTPPPHTPPPGGYGGGGLGGHGAPYATMAAVAGAPHAARPMMRSLRASHEAVGVIAGGVIASDIASYILGRRAGMRKAAKERPVERKRLEQRVSQLEKALITKESRIQQLATERPVKTRVVEVTREVPLPVPMPTESRLSMTKPERVEHIGKSIVEKAVPYEKIVVKEKMVRPHSIRDYYNPEHVKSMRRRELLEISEKIVVDGGSLKVMYENGLFGERALRRLVVDYLRGKDIRPRLRREIVERQIDFERDPVLRDKGNSSAMDFSPVVFDHMLQTSRTSDDNSTSAANNKTKAKTNKKSKNKAMKDSSFYQLSSGQWLLAVIAILLIIIALLLSGRY